MKKRILFLNIITFGLFHLIASAKAKKKFNGKNKLNEVGKIPFSIEDFISKLGGIENIISSSATINVLTVIVKNNSNIVKNDFSNFKIKGFMKTGDKIILTIGDIANSINLEIKKRI
ncbi:MAG: hypothetical protein LBD05_02360 [Mycoplasmataceae bacterium]|jgi:phosphotransferase system IIB component|nr:hypothetical protein [Mycoplasmataceae bacterium]